MDTQQTSKSLYDAGIGEIAAKEFVAGFMRGLGSFVMTILTWVIMYFLVMRFVFPQLSGYLTQAQSMIESLQSVQKGAAGMQQNLSLPETLLQQLR